jgi:plasmid stabilization system protein ParE
MKVRLMPGAERDLDEIVDWIAKDNPTRAVTFAQELKEQCLELGGSPRGYPLVPRYERRGVRRKVHRSYLIFYRIEKSHVAVLRILHGARDYIPLLFPN